VSPDGRYLAVQQDVSTVLPEGDLALRPLAAPTLTPLVTGRQRGPTFSPDSAWVLYDTLDSLYKVPVAGGTPQRIVPVQNARGASWGPGGTIVFAPGTTSSLWKVSALGGDPEEITVRDTEKGESSHRWPFVLPDGQGVLFSVLTDANERAIDVVELDGSGRKQVYASGTDPRYLPTGHLVFVDGASLFAVPFDLSTRQVRGAAIPVVDGVYTDGAGRAHWSVSDNGVLVYRSGTVDVPKHQIVSVAENGDQQVLWKEAATFLEPRLSPDARKLVVCQLGGAGLDIWVYDIARQVPTRLTFDDADDCPGVWSPDGETVIFSSAVNGALDLYRKRADGSGDIERITEDPDQAYYVSDWSPDGSTAIVTAGTGDILTLALDTPDAKPEPYLVTEFGEAEADFSPDGRWVTYQSNESGRNEIYVRPFPSGPGKWQISTGGGAYPRWGLDGRQVYYRTATGLAAATVDVEGSALSIGNARPVLTGSFRGGLGGIAVNNSIWADWAVAPGGRFVLFPAPDAGANDAATTLQVVTNWFEELKRRVPTGR
jgi:serine/threonine-protein kinase